MVISTAGRGRVKIHGAVNLETFDAPFVEPTTVDGVSAAQLLTKIEERNPDKRIIHVIWDNAAYYTGADVRAFLARTACRIHLIQLPPYCPHLNPPSRACKHALPGNNRAALGRLVSIRYPQLLLSKSEAVRRRHPCIPALNHPAGMDEIPRQGLRQIPSHTPRELSGSEVEAVYRSKRCCFP